MNDEDLKKIFTGTGPVKPSEEARQKAKATALAAFAEIHGQDESTDIKNNGESGQGFSNNSRPTSDNVINLRSRIMESLNNRWLISGAASAAVLVISVSVLMVVGTAPLQQTTPSPDRKLADVLVESRSKAAQANRQAINSQATNSEATNSEVAVEQDLDNSVAVSAPPAEAPSMRDWAVKEERADIHSYEPTPEEHVVMAPTSPADTAGLQSKSKSEMASDSGFVSGLLGSSSEEVVVTAAKRAPAAASRIALEATGQVAQSISDDAIGSNYFQEKGRDDFEHVETNPVKQVAEEPVSTFSVDVDTASYSFVRRQLNQGVLPQKDAVRVEEMINYFDYQYPAPESKKQPFKTTVSVLDSPWRNGNKLVHIGIRGFDIKGERPDSNLVFLLDVSGSMNSPDKLPLVKQSMGMLLSQLKPTDTVAIVAYAGAAGTVLEPTEVKEKQKILAALDRLSAGGSTAGGEGIKLAYRMAALNFAPNAVNRVMLATDGDFNIGITDKDELKGFVERERRKGIFLSVLGFGQGNYQDSRMQALAQSGNGVAAYIDTLGEAQKVLVDEATSTLFPIAKDVKIQVEFNPATVSEYRLLGYETRMLKREDFNNDEVDAGDIGAGHRVTAIYEITPAGANSGLLEPSRYTNSAPKESERSDEYGFLKLRYKLPDEDKSHLIEIPLSVDNQTSQLIRTEAEFATAVAGFAQILRGGEYTGNWNYEDVIALANRAKGDDLFGYRSEFVQLVHKASLAQAMR